MQGKVKNYLGKQKMVKDQDISLQDMELAEAGDEIMAEVAEAADQDQEDKVLEDKLLKILEEVLQNQIDKIVLDNKQQ